jgi:hypothetical protein
MQTIIHCFPNPAQSIDFLELHYFNQYGQPEGANSGLYLHPWAQHDCMGLAAEMEIKRESDDGFRVWLYQYQWSGWQDDLLSFDRDKCSAIAYDSHDTFGGFFNAEAYAQFCWARWRATGSAGSSGMRWRDDLDSRFNPC